MKIESAKGAARAARGVGNCFAPYSVLREFLEQNLFPIASSVVAKPIRR
jgi:hypothetical protein